MKTLTVLSRSYCHLCDDLIAALESFRAAMPRQSVFAVEILDVDADAAHEARWGEKVPVLLDGEIEICHYFFDAAKLRERLAACE